MARILVIEDDPTAREMLSFRLKKSGYDVAEALDGDDGLLKAMRRPDLIILDIRLPKIDGWNLCKMLKAEPRSQAIPIIMLTGCGQSIQEDYGKLCGADAYVTKPWDSKKLLQLIKQLLTPRDPPMDLSTEETQRLARFSLDHSGEATLWTDGEGRITYANAAAARILRREAKSLIHKTLFEIAPELNPDLWRELWKEIRAQESFSFEFTLLAAENEEVAVDIVARRIGIGSKEFATLIFRDIEERKRLKALEQGFVSTVSHELRTPLTVIREGVSQVIDGIRGDITEMQRRALAIALTGIDRLTRLIEELLDLSKMEAGRLRLPLERVDVSALVHEVCISFQPMADDRHIDLRVVVPGEPAITFAARDRLIQVLTNLIDNAFKFTERGRIELKVTLSPEAITCDVTDTGMGFAPDQAQRIFNRFEQLDTLSVTGEKGTGLGLSICKGIIELHKGRIWAESPGVKQGSRFIFELPKRDARSVFREQISRRVEEISQRGGSLSAVVLQLQAKGAALSEERHRTLMNHLENLAQQERGRQSEALITDTQTLYLALPGTVHKEALRIAERIQSAFQKILQQEKLTEQLQLTHRVSSFPDPFADPRTFIQNAVPPKTA